VVSVHVAETERTAKSDRSSENVANGFVLPPHREEFVRKSFDGERQVVHTEGLHITEVGISGKLSIFSKGNGRAVYVFPVLITYFEFPLVAGDEPIVDPMFSLVVR